MRNCYIFTYFLQREDEEIEKSVLRGYRDSNRLDGERSWRGWGLGCRPASCAAGPRHISDLSTSTGEK